MAKMRIMLPTRVTELVGVGGAVSGSTPSAVRPFLNHPHLSRPPRLLVKLGYETNYRV